MKLILVKKNKFNGLSIADILNLIDQLKTTIKKRSRSGKISVKELEELKFAIQGLGKMAEQCLADLEVSSQLTKK